MLYETSRRTGGQRKYETRVSMLPVDETCVSNFAMSSPLARCIRDVYDRLPTGERRLADVILGMQSDLAAYSATELAERAGVSKATAARLVRRLGYNGYQEMRQQARAHNENGSPLAGLSDALGRKGSLSHHLGHDLASLSQSLETIRPDLAERAIEILAEADRIWVVGYRNSHVLALYARGLLLQVKSDVRLLPMPGQTLAEELSALTARDAVLMVGFRRRPPALAKLLGTAAEVGARVVLLGDPSLGDIGKHADVTFRCLTQGSSLFDSYVAPVSLLNFLCSGVALALGESAQARLRRTEALHDFYGDFTA
jgi:DNA-binding MurR/RpiR family transcriptional regulator